MRYTCPCCGYKTLQERFLFDICDICYWEDDNVQAVNPDVEGGANVVSLRQAQKNFVRFGACEENMRNVVRKPTIYDERDTNWRMLGDLSD